jgi:DNA-binding response OmpR family regulator
MNNAQPGIHRYALVVDDDESNRELVAELLRSEGYAVTCAASVEEALEALSSTPPDVILLDLCMPNMDGWGFLARANTPAPVVIISAQDRPEGLDVAAYLRKPFEVEELLATVATVTWRP